MTGLIEFVLVAVALVIWALIGSVMFDVFRHSH
jgi:hypothetical protein